MPSLILLLACIIGFVHIFAAIMVQTRERGTEWNMGPRDEPEPDMPPVVGRLRRAQENFLETFPIFAALLLACMIHGVSDWRVVGGGWLYLIARAAYLPVYAKGTAGLRTAIWMVSLLGIVLVGWAAVLP